MSRILIYSHNVIGIGHVRMAVKMADALSHTGEHSCLVVSGSSHVPCPPKDSGWEIIKLPSLFKTNRSFYSATYLRSRDTFDLRRKMLLSIAISFNPDLLIVYHSPIGLRGELLDVLNHCRDRGARAVLILRDILNSPDLTTSSWERKGYYSFVNELYQLIVHQGEHAIFNAEAQYKYPVQLADKVVYSGYALPLSRLDDSRKTVGTLVSIGGGRVGYDLFDELLRADVRDRLLPCPIKLLLGPLTPITVRRRLESSARDRSDVMVCDPVADPMPLFAGSHIIIHNGGYNTTCEAIISGRPSYIWPRYTAKDRECQIRAAALDGLGIVRHVIATSAILPFTPAFERLTWGGLSRLTSIITAVSEGQSSGKIKRDFSLEL